MSDKESQIATFRREYVQKSVVGRSNSQEDTEQRRTTTSDSESIYLDYMGSGLFCTEQLEAFMAQIPLLANPHSNHVAGATARETMLAARWAVLKHFDAVDNYEVIFTSGCTGALKLVADNFKPFHSVEETLEGDDGAGKFYCHRFAHNSLLGIRECCPLVAAADDKKDTNRNFELFTDVEEIVSEEQDTPILVGFPAECNFSGWRPPLKQWVKKLREQDDKNVPSRTAILVDGAAASPHMKVSLDDSTIDFFTCSFYKMFGFPTGLGALLVRKETASRWLNKRYFGGGTVEFVIPSGAGGPKGDGEGGAHKFRTTNLSSKFEDGTPNFQSIAAVASGLRAITRFDEGNMLQVQERCDALAKQCAERLQCLKHNKNDAPLVSVCGHTSISSPSLPQGSSFGPTVAFRVMDSNGAPIGHSIVEKLAAVNNVLLRCGCFCNPGACQFFLGHSDEDIADFAKAGHVCWDDRDVIDGKATGCVRVSFGVYSVSSDINALVQFLTSCFAEKKDVAEVDSLASATNEDLEEEDESAKRRIVSITVFPVKGCQGFSALRWPLTRSGLLYDREWMIIDALDAAPITPKRQPAIMSLEVSMLLSDQQVLRIFSPKTNSVLFVPLAHDSGNQLNASDLRKENTKRIVWGKLLSDQESLLEKMTKKKQKTIIIKSKKIEEYCVYNDATNTWISEALGHPAQLVRRPKPKVEEKNKNNTSKKQQLFSNTGSLLVVNTSSHDVVSRTIWDKNERDENKKNRNEHDYTEGVTIESYRANLIVSGANKDGLFEENKWEKLQIATENTKTTTTSGDGKNTSFITISSSGACHRCQQVGARSGAIFSEPLQSIASLCRTRPSPYNRSSGPVLGEVFDWIEDPDDWENVDVTSGLEEAANGCTPNTDSMQEPNAVVVSSSTSSISQSISYIILGLTACCVAGEFMGLRKQQQPKTQQEQSVLKSVILRSVSIASVVVGLSTILSAETPTTTSSGRTNKQLDVPPTFTNGGHPFITVGATVTPVLKTPPPQECAESDGGETCAACVR